MRRNRLAIGEERQLGLPLHLDVEDLDALEPGFLLRVVDLAQVEHAEFDALPAGTHNLLGDSVLAGFSHVFGPCMALVYQPLRQPPCHLVAMLVPEVAVGLGDQNSTVLMPLPVRERLEIHTLLDRTRDEAAP